MSTRLLSVREAAEALGVCCDTIYRLVARQQLPCLRIGRSIKFQRAALDAWVEQQMTTPQEPLAPSAPRPCATYPPPQRPGYVPIRPVRL
jgi:excisionase family DNA binding protein